MKNRTRRKERYQAALRHFYRGDAVDETIRAWDMVRPVGREFGSPDFERLMALDNAAHFHQLSKDKALARLATYRPGHPLGDSSITSKPDHITIVEALIECLPVDIPIPAVMRNEQGEIGVYWDVDDVYVDIRVDEGGTLSVFCYVRSTNHESSLEGIQITDLTPEWARIHLRLLVRESAI